MQNPFSTTFSRIPEYTYISTTGVDDILENFSFEEPTEYVYKITGLRGSGKTVILSKVQQTLSEERFREQGWLVYNLNPSRDMLVQLAAFLAKEEFVKTRAKSKSISISASVMGTGGALGYSSEKDESYFDIGVEIKEMLKLAQEKGKKIMICVDEVSKNKEMIVFGLEYGGWLISGFPVYFVCTGLYENMVELGNAKNLTFFRRGKTIETKPLSSIRMTDTYSKKLGIDTQTAKKMADVTKGYAYAFQELGSLYFKKPDKSTLEDVIEQLKVELYSYSYEKIWEELSEEDKFLARLIAGKDEYKREEVLRLMGNKAKNYSVYRDRLLKRGIISARQGYISLNPPFFAEYIKEYQL